VESWHTELVILIALLALAKVIVIDLFESESLLALATLVFVVATTSWLRRERDVRLGKAPRPRADASEAELRGQ
jgi:hypothetical protein